MRKLRPMVWFDTVTCVLAACVLVVLTSGCGEPPLPWVDHATRLNVVFNFRSIQDWPENIPYVRTEGNLEVKGELRKSPLYREMHGVKYGGEKVEVVAAMTYEAPGTQVFEVVSRRFNEPRHHIDIHVNSAVHWEMFVENFAGYVVDADGDKTLQPRYRFDPGKYHLKAYKDRPPASSTGSASSM